MLQDILLFSIGRLLMFRLIDLQNGEKQYCFLCSSPEDYPFKITQNLSAPYLRRPIIRSENIRSRGLIQVHQTIFEELENPRNALGRSSKPATHSFTARSMWTNELTGMGFIPSLQTQEPWLKYCGVFIRDFVSPTHKRIFVEFFQFVFATVEWPWELFWKFRWF